MLCEPMLNSSSMQLLPFSMYIKIISISSFFLFILMRAFTVTASIVFRLGIASVEN